MAEGDPGRQRVGQEEERVGEVATPAASVAQER